MPRSNEHDVVGCRHARELRVRTWRYVVLCACLKQDAAIGKFLRCDPTVLGKALTYARLVPPGLMHREGMFVVKDTWPRTT